MQVHSYYISFVMKKIALSLNLVLTLSLFSCAQSDAPTSYYLFTELNEDEEMDDPMDQSVDHMRDMSVDVANARPSSASVDDCEEERCDALDNDCDGSVDEDVVCECSDDESCYGGPPETRGVGSCQDGARECMDDDSWGVCEEWIGPTEERCDDEDNDCDGEVDEGVLNPCGGCGNIPLELCDREDNDCDGKIDEGLRNACGTCGEAPVEVCDGFDNDCDGETDEGLRNACGICGALPEEVCDFIDNDCDGAVDEGACMMTEVRVEGDCVTIACPPEMPHPVACQFDFQGDDSRGCIAHQPGESSVYVQEGRLCSAGQVSGYLVCSSEQVMGIDATTCPINKSDARYRAERGECP